MISAQPFVDTGTLEDLEFQPPCEIVLHYWYIGITGPPCGKPAEYNADIHNPATHKYVNKFLCVPCRAVLLPTCAAGCGAATVKNLRPIGGTPA